MEYPRYQTTLALLFFLLRVEVLLGIGRGKIFKFFTDSSLVIVQDHPGGCKSNSPELSAFVSLRSSSLRVCRRIRVYCLLGLNVAAHVR